MHEAVVTRTSIKLRNSFLFRFRRRENLKGQNSAKSRLLSLKIFQHLLHIHWKEFLSFIPWVSHAVMIQQQNHNCCDTGSVQKSRKVKASATTFRPYTGYNSAIEFSIIGQSRHEKDLG